MTQDDIQALAEIMNEEAAEAFKRTAARVKVAHLDERIPWPIARQVMVSIVRAMADTFAATPDDVPPYDSLSAAEQQVIRDIQQLSRDYRPTQEEDP